MAVTGHRTLEEVERYTKQSFSGVGRSEDGKNDPGYPFSINSKTKSIGITTE
jgi:hypothetical protein